VNKSVDSFLKQDKPLVVSCYARVSKDNKDALNSLDNQIRYFKDFIKNNPHWVLGAVYFDEGLCGTSTKKRAGFNKMLKDGFDGKFDYVLTKEVSRFARNTVDALESIRQLKQHGIGVYFSIDNIDTLSSDGELRLTIMASMAQEESRKSSERVLWGQRRIMEQGFVLGRQPFGYELAGGTLKILEDEASIVRMIFDKFVDGKGTGIIARELNEGGFLPSAKKASKKWNSVMIKAVLSNEKYVGDLLQKKAYTVDYLTKERKLNRGQVEKVFIGNHHERIVERKVWEKAQEIALKKWGCVGARCAEDGGAVETEVAAEVAAANRKFLNRYWCSGKVVCGVCGKNFSGGSKRWRCQSKDCDNPSVLDKTLLSLVQRAIGLIDINKDNLINEMLCSIKSTLPIPKAAPTNKIQAIDSMLDGTITKEQLKKQLSIHDENLAQLNHIHSLTKQQASQILLELNTPSPPLCAFLLDRIIIEKHKIVTIYLKNWGVLNVGI